jgi:hypothetical protein
MKRAADVFQSEIPAVFVNCVGKANPSAEQVTAVCHRTS